MIAALFVAKGGCYFGLPDVDPWDEARDARKYAGPWPVVAHPPCARWSRLARFVEVRHGRKVGDDGGCFTAALAAVLSWGGVLEHPAWSLAWAAHGLPEPRADGWIRTLEGGWVCEVNQQHYGHRSPKATWLFYVGDASPPSLDWSRATRPTMNRSGRRRVGGVELASRAARIATPPAFRDVLLSIARSARRTEAA